MSRYDVVLSNILKLLSTQVVKEVFCIYGKINRDSISLLHAEERLLSSWAHSWDNKSYSMEYGILSF